MRVVDACVPTAIVVLVVEAFEIYRGKCVVAKMVPSMKKINQWRIFNDIIISGGGGGNLLKCQIVLLMMRRGNWGSITLEIFICKPVGSVEEICR